MSPKVPDCCESDPVDTSMNVSGDKQHEPGRWGADAQ